MTVHSRIQIDAPPQALFDYVSDMTRHTEWANQARAREGARRDRRRALGRRRRGSCARRDRRGADAAFECLGRPETIELARRVTAPGGTTVLVGMAAPDVLVAMPALEVTTKEKTLTGSWYGSVVPARDFPMLADLLGRGELRLESMIARTIALEEIGDALARFEAGEETRSVIVYEA